MQLNHFDLAVPDLAAATDFFEKGFGFRVVNRLEGMRILVGDGGFVLGLTECEEPHYPESFHIGFLQPFARGGQRRASALAGGRDRGSRAAGRCFRRVHLLLPRPGGVQVEIAYRPS